VDYTVTCGDTSFTGTVVPHSFNGLPSGLCTVARISGGPPGGSFTGISPLPPQSLLGNGVVIFALTYLSNQPPTAGFLMSAQGKTAPQGQILNLAVPPLGVEIVSFDGRPPRSSDSDGTIASYEWRSNGTRIPDPTFTGGLMQFGLGKGTHNISLIVIDNAGSSATATATVVVTESTPQPTAPTGSMKVPRFGHQATLLNNGLVLVTGGATMGNTAVASAEIYDPQTGLWRDTRQAALGGGPLLMSIARNAHTAVKLSDGRVLIAAGTGNGGSIAAAEIFDPATETFTPTGSLNLARGGHETVVLADGRVMLLAGRSTAAPCCTVASTEIYNPATGTWSFAASVPTGTSLGTIFPGYTDHRAALLNDGKVLLTGGYNGATGMVASAALRYDPAGNNWEVLTPMRSVRLQHSIAVLPNGKVLIAGGRVTDSTNSFTSTEIYDPGFLPNGSSTAGNPLSVGRALHTATVVNGKVLVAGGLAYPASTPGTAISNSSLELFDPGSGTWSEIGPMASARAYHTATLLPSGKVLLVGGFDRHDAVLANVLNTAEVVTVP
jgi:Kelch motif/Galactose oxidase, central domain